MVSSEGVGETKLRKLFSQLDSLLKDGGTLKSILRTIESILTLRPKDADALKSKAVAYIRHEDFESALQVIDQNADIREGLAFEQAYCHYRLGHLDKALKVVATVGEERRQARLQLEAQLQYKLNDFAAAIDSYQKLFREYKVDTLELQANAVAAHVCGGQSSEVSQLKRQLCTLGDSAELNFNLACSLLQQGELPAAEDQLQLALRAGREQMLLEDFNEAAIAGELAPLSAQLAYIHSQLGLSEEAAAEYKAVSDLDDLDATTAAVVQNNCVAAAATVAASSGAPKKGAQEALRRLDRLFESSGTHLQPALESRLLNSQKQEILANRVLLMAAANKQDAAKVAMSTLQYRFPSYPRAWLLQAALLAIKGKTRAAESVLGQLQKISASLGIATEAALMRAQLAAALGDRHRALQALCHLPDDKRQNQPAVVATIVSLQEAEGDTAGAVRTLEAALEWWQNAMDDDSRPARRPDSWMMQRLVQAHVANGNLEAARQLFDRMESRNGSAAHSAAEAEALVSLATAIALQGGMGIEGLEDHLDPLEPMDAAEVSRLKSSAAASIVRSTAAKEEEGASQKRRKRKKRAPLYPAGFDPEHPGPPPNPERWLPKWQRTEFKKQRKALEKRRAAGKEVKGSQGKGLVDESLDISQQARPQANTAGPSLGGRSGKVAGRRKGRH